ncbi:MAG: hypothetical protein FJZ57_04765 [Chlamydiae bacterium]|nr:hypothetical protein [Chlamydiota bacterium]
MTYWFLKDIKSWRLFVFFKTDAKDLYSKIESGVLSQKLISLEINVELIISSSTYKDTFRFLLQGNFEPKAFKEGL